MTAPEPLDPHTFGPDQPCFGCGPVNPRGLHMRFAREGDAVTTRVTLGAEFQSAPGMVHGGIVATVADELAGWTIIGLRERYGFTGSAEVRWLAPVRPGVEIEGRGEITRGNSRVLKVAVVLRQQGAEVFRGEFTFVLLDVAAAEKMLGGPLNEAWKRFCR